MTCVLCSPSPLAGYRRNVGIMLIGPHGRIFAGQRRDNGAEAWQMPQGGIDKGETPRAAALRELEEEVGTGKAEVLRESAGWLNYDLPDEIAQRMWRGRWRGQTQKWFAMRFLGGDGDINIATAHPEFQVWRWMPAEEMLGTIVPFKREVYRAVCEEFADLLTDTTS
jgi:putative (di)nucleoside polyphosphate hydrolase